MLSRALSLATVTLLIGCLTAGVARAVENLDAGKSPSQIFSNTCSACHKSPRGLLKNVSASSLPGFLRQHYTTGTDMASHALFLPDIQRGRRPPVSEQGSIEAEERQAGRADGKPDQPDRLGRRQPPAAPAQEASRPNADGAAPQGEGARPGRDAKRFARPAPEAAKPADGQTPVQAATESKPGVRQKQGRRGKPVTEEPPKTEQPAPGDAAKEDASRDAAKAETAATDPAKTDAIKTDADQDRRDQGRGRQAGRRRSEARRRVRKAGTRERIRYRQSRCSQGERRQRAEPAQARSGAAGRASAASFRSDRA